MKCIKLTAFFSFCIIISKLETISPAACFQKNIKKKLMKARQRYERNAAEVGNKWCKEKKKLHSSALHFLSSCRVLSDLIFLPVSCQHRQMLCLAQPCIEWKQHNKWRGEATSSPNQAFFCSTRGTEGNKIPTDEKRLQECKQQTWWDTVQYSG